MKILFTADIHIKLGQKGVPVSWAKNRYRLFIQALHNHSDDADMVIIGGDIFDRLPTMEELEIYYALVLSCVKPTLIYPGNHEATKKGHTFFTHLQHVTHKLNPLVYVIDDYYVDESSEFEILPYNKLVDFTKGLVQERETQILFTHVRGEIPPHVKPEIDLSLLDEWKIVFAGDLHSHENSQRNIVYPGSPMTTSFHRTKTETGVILIDTKDFSYSWIPLGLPQLIRKTISAGEEAIPTEYDHTVYEIEGDMTELSNFESSDLVDRKVVKRTSETALILDANMSVIDEISEYLKYILVLPQETVDEVIKEFANHAEKLNWE